MKYNKYQRIQKHKKIKIYNYKKNTKILKNRRVKQKKMLKYTKNKCKQNKKP